MIKLSFVIPCYGSEHTLEKVIAEIKETVKAGRGYDYEIILVDDNSPDDVFGVIKKLCAADKKIKGVRLTKNFGQQSALMAGLRAAGGNLVICLDDDGQSPASEIYKLIEKVDEGYDVVYAGYGMKKQSLLKNFGSWLNSFMFEVILNKPPHIKLSSFFVMKRIVSEEMIKYKNPYPYNIGMILSITRKITSVQCEDRQRLTGRTGYTFAKLVGLWLNGFINFSVKPLRVATVLGFICGLFGLGFGIYTVIYKILNPAVPAGYSAIISMVSFIGGMNMLLLGLVGEYIGRIYLSINRNPQYVVRETVNIKNNVKEL